MELLHIPGSHPRAVFIAKHGRQNGRIGKGICGGDKPRNRCRIQPRIGVGEQHEFRCCRSHPDVAACAKAKIGRVADHARAGRFRHRRAVIAARIIHHNHAKARWHAPQHPAQGGRTVIGDRDNAKACQGKGSIQPFKPRNPAQMRSTCASVNSGYMGTLITSCAASAVSAQPAGPSGTRP